MILSTEVGVEMSLVGVSRWYSHICMEMCMRALFYLICANECMNAILTVDVSI